MQITIQLVNVSKTTVPTAKGSYVKYEVAYKKDGKLEGKNILSFSAKEVCKFLDTAVSGESYVVNMEKNDKGYWDWKSISAAGAGGEQPTSTASTSAGTAARTTPKGDWETKEERAAKQILIVKQSSLAQAVSTLAAGAKSHPNPADVIALAQTYTDWILARPAAPAQAATSAAEELEDEIPF